MQVDWLTVAAQAANFLVLVWLLKRFLYRPVIRAMEMREAGIEARLSEARESRRQADVEAEKLRQKQRELDQNRENLLQEARDQARDLHVKLEDELREKFAVRQRAWAEHIADERGDYLHDLRKRTGQHVLKITRAILSEFADTDLSDRLADRFIEKLRTLDAGKLERLTGAAEKRSQNTIVESSGPLPTSIRSRITKVLHEVISDQIKIEYRTNEELTLGLRLTIAEQVVEWSAGAHLDRLEALLDDALDTLDKPLTAGGSF